MESVSGPKVGSIDTKDKVETRKEGVLNIEKCGKIRITFRRTIVGRQGSG
jgi:hypothetical protein